MSEPDTTTEPTSPPAGQRPMRVLFGRQAPFGPEEDPNAAPGARPRRAGTRRWSARRAGENAVWTFGLGLIFLAFFLIPLLAEPRPVWQLALIVVLVALSALLYLGTALATDLSLAGRYAYLSLYCLVTLAALAPFGGIYVFALGTYITVMVVYLLPWRQARIGVLLWFLVSLGVGVAATDWVVIVMSGVAAAVGILMGIGIEFGRLQRCLDVAQTRIATLAVAAERERIGRDLHDILGHSLTSIAVKAGLAGRLADRDVEAAKAQMREVEEVARQALADVRATASGFREVRLTGELASARSVLLAAGIDCNAPAAVDAMSDEVSEFLGYAVREGVTNVVRHSRARTCVITADGHRVTIVDDGVGIASDRAGGSGLRSLADRAGRVGGYVTAERREPAGTVLTAGVGPGARAGA